MVPSFSAGGATIKLARQGDKDTPLGWGDVTAEMRAAEARFQFNEDMWAHWGPAMQRSRGAEEQTSSKL